MKEKIKKILFITILIILAVGLIFVFNYTYTIEGNITDIATKKAVTGVKVKIANHESITDNQGNYTLKGIKIYQKKNLLVEVSKEYVEVNPIEIDYGHRSIKRDFTIEPTLERVVTLVNTAVKNIQYDYIWDFIHPDVKVYWDSKDEYVALNKLVADVIGQRTLGKSIKSITISDNIRMLDVWKFRTINPDREYQNIVEVPIEIIYIQDGKERPRAGLLYYQRTNGFYHFFASIEKDRLKNQVELYNIYDKINTYDMEEIYRDFEKLFEQPSPSSEKIGVQKIQPEVKSELKLPSQPKQEKIEEDINEFKEEQFEEQDDDLESVVPSDDTTTLEPQDYMTELVGPSSGADSDAIIESHCQSEWPSDSDMKEYCKRQQYDGLATLSQGRPLDVTDLQFITIRQHCEGEWPTDFNMRAYCEKQQYDAIRTLNLGKPSDISNGEYAIILAECIKEWPTDFNMRAYCEKQQYDAIRTLNLGKPSNLSQAEFESIRSSCANEWPGDFSMRVYCEKQMD